MYTRRRSVPAKHTRARILCNAFGNTFITSPCPRYSGHVVVGFNFANWVRGLRVIRCDVRTRLRIRVSDEHLHCSDDRSTTRESDSGENRSPDKKKRDFTVLLCMRGEKNCRKRSDDTNRCWPNLRVATKHREASAHRDSC